MCPKKKKFIEKNFLFNNKYVFRINLVNQLLMNRFYHFLLYRYHKHQHEEYLVLENDY